MKRILALILTLAVLVLPMAAMAETAEMEAVQSLAGNLAGVMQNGKKITETYSFEVPEQKPETDNPMVGMIMDLLGSLGTSSSMQNGQVTDVLMLQGQEALSLTIGASDKGLFLGSNLLGDTVIGLDGEDMIKLMQSAGNLPVNEDGSLNLNFAAELDMANTMTAVQELMGKALSMTQVEEWSNDSDPAVTAIQVNLDGESIASVAKALIKDLQPMKETLDQMNAGQILEVSDEEIDEKTKNILITISVYMNESQEVVAFEMDANNTDEAAPQTSVALGYRSTDGETQSWAIQLQSENSEKKEYETIDLAYTLDGNAVSMTLVDYEPSGDQFAAKASCVFNYEGTIAATALNGTISLEIYAANAETGAMDPNGALVYNYDLACDGQTCSGNTQIQLKANIDADPIVTANGTVATADADPLIAESENVTYIMKLSAEEQQEFGNNLMSGMMMKLMTIISLLPESVQQIVGSMMQ